MPGFVFLSTAEFLAPKNYAELQLYSQQIFVDWSFVLP